MCCGDFYRPTEIDTRFSDPNGGSRTESRYKEATVTLAGVIYVTGTENQHFRYPLIMAPRIFIALLNSSMIDRYGNRRRVDRCDLHSKYLKFTANLFCARYFFFCFFPHDRVIVENCEESRNVGLLCAAGNNSSRGCAGGKFIFLSARDYIISSI